MINNAMKNYMDVYNDYIELADEAYCSAFYVNDNFHINKKKKIKEDEDGRFGFSITLKGLIKQLHEYPNSSMNRKEINYDTLYDLIEDVKNYLQNYKFKTYHKFDNQYIEDEKLRYNLSLLDTLFIEYRDNFFEDEETLLDIPSNKTVYDLINGKYSKDNIISLLNGLKHKEEFQNIPWLSYLEYLVKNINFYEPEFFTMFKNLFHFPSFEEDTHFQSFLDDTVLFNEYPFSLYDNGNFDGEIRKHFDSNPFSDYQRNETLYTNILTNEKNKISFCQNIYIPDQYFVYNLDPYFDILNENIKYFEDLKNKFLFKSLFQEIIPAISAFIHILKIYKVNIFKKNIYEKIEKSFNELLDICMNFYMNNKKECSKWLNNIIKKLKMNKIVPAISMNALFRTTTLNSILYGYIKDILDTDYTNKVDLHKKYGITESNISKFVLLGLTE